MKISAIILISFFLIISSCSKDKVQHPFAGSYDCTVNHSYWDMTGNNSSSISYEIVDVLLIEDSIEVFGARVHADSIVEGQSYFFGGSSNYMSFQFKNDSIYTSHFSGGLGGGSSTSYAGKKIN